MVVRPPGGAFRGSFTGIGLVLSWGAVVGSPPSGRGGPPSLRLWRWVFGLLALLPWAVAFHKQQNPNIAKAFEELRVDSQDVSLSATLFGFDDGSPAEQ